MAEGSQRVIVFRVNSVYNEGRAGGLYSEWTQYTTPPLNPPGARANGRRSGTSKTEGRSDGQTSNGGRQTPTIIDHRSTVEGTMGLSPRTSHSMLLHGGLSSVAPSPNPPVTINIEGRRRGFSCRHYEWSCSRSQTKT